MPDTDADTAAAAIELLRKRVEDDLIEYDDKQLKVTISAGIATFPSAAASRPRLFEAADKALYASKSAGRNRVTHAPAGS